MTIAIVMPSAELLGGAELTLLHLLENIQETDTECLVIFLEDGPMVAQTRSLGYRSMIIPAGRLSRPKQYLGAVAKIARALRKNRVDLVFGWMTKAHLYSGPAALLAKIPAMWYQHGMASPGSRFEEMANRIPAAGILTCGAAGMRAQRGMSPARFVRVVNPGVEIGRFDPRALPSPSEARRNLGLPPTGPLIGIVGRLQRWKGMHVLVEAAPRILQTHPDAHFVVVGGGHAREPDYEPFLLRRISEIGLADRFTLAGAQSNVPEWMQALDVFVHASDSEPFGMVIIEAMALGKAVVAGQEGGPAEIISDGIDGLLSPYGDSGALARQILRYLDDPDFARRLGAAARDRAAEFSTRRYAENFLGAVRDVWESRAPRRAARQAA